MNSIELREECARRLLAAEEQVKHLSAFVGLDGFVDEIVHVVDKRDSSDSFTKVATIAQLAQRIGGASGRSTNIELVTVRTKLGGNGPIMANALASFGMKVTYLGALGYPTMHPVFNGFAEKAGVHTIAESGHTDALEFEDGKLMFGKLIQLSEITWENIQARFGRDQFAARFASSDLIGFVNWTMIPHMGDIWESLLKELCPALSGPRRKIFFDLADPEKRTRQDISRALELIASFQPYFDVILGLNEKEAAEISTVMDISHRPHTPEGLAETACEINSRLRLSTLVVHPVAFALAVSDGMASVIQGPVVAKPLITTGAGDHFNSGFCLGKLLGFDNNLSTLTGVTTSGYYVRTGHSPTVSQLAGMLRDWPTK